MSFEPGPSRTIDVCNQVIVVVKRMQNSCGNTARGTHPLRWHDALLGIKGYGILARFVKDVGGEFSYEYIPGMTNVIRGYSSVVAVDVIE